MTSNYLFENIKILDGPGSSIREETVLIENGVIKAFGKQAFHNGNLLGLEPQKAQNKLMIFLQWNG